MWVHPLGTCHAPSLHASRAVTWLTVYRAPQVLAFSKNILTKIEIARSPVVRFALKPSQVGFDMYRFGWCEREVQENSVARE